MKRSCLPLSIVLTPVLLLAQASKLAPELQQASGVRPVPVIVQYKNVSPALPLGVLGLRNLQASAPLGVINGVEATVPADALAAGRVRVRGDLAALVAGQSLLYAAAERLGTTLDALTDAADAASPDGAGGDAGG